MVLSVGRHSLAKPKRRWSRAIAALVVPAAAFMTAGAASFTGQRAVGGGPLCCAEVVAAPQPNTLKLIDPAQGELVVSAGAVTQDLTHALPAGVASEQGLQVKTILAARVISALFPEIRNIGGVRPDSLRWHPNGMALDVMIPDYQSAAGKELGDRVAAYALDNAERLGVDHVIWRQVLHMPGGKTRMMGDYGSDDANHYTHVHITTSGGGFPTGEETYFTSAGGPAVSDGSVMNTMIGAH